MVLYWPNFSLMFLIHLFLHAGVHCISLTKREGRTGRILGLQPRDKAAMLVVNTKEIFLLNLHQNRVHFTAERNAFVLDHQHGRRDVTCKPAISARGLDSTDRGPIFSQYGPERAWLIRHLLHDRKQSFKILCFLKKRKDACET